MFKTNVPKSENLNPTEIFAEDVFSMKVMKRFLPVQIFKKLQQTVQKCAPLDPEIAQDVAAAMKTWAIEKGATHYTHWFQPLTGTTAEKHDSFIEPDGAMGITMEFSGKNLVKGEPDASSFPSGGLRATFEARGYTAWDPTSPAFIKRTGQTATLCIPTAFCSYTGEALDKKTPLLRSVDTVGYQAKRLLACFGEKIDGIVSTQLGAEQEYFLIDRAFYDKRLDLQMCGRTLFGTVPPKHQQMEDHYFGSIKSRVLSFMMEVDQELWRLGIPAKTRHNEVAPSQFEIAPVFEDLNLAVDHNMILMEVLRVVAERYDFVCLLHEKPYAGINGSGKHNNWSLSVPGYGCLFNPGKNPHENAIFLTFICGIIMAVDRHADLIRAAVANAGNEHRLGANEAPPAIISIFFGDLLTEILEQIEKGAKRAYKSKAAMNIGVDALPLLPRDSSDRNRTSPFAFTGNKFEFRAVGASQNCAWPMTILNTIAAEAFDEMATRMEPFANTAVFHLELQKMLQEIVKSHKRIIFNGDGYRDAWVLEAEKRGLPHLKTVADSLAVFKKQSNIDLFDKYKILSPSELHARYEVHWEIYIKQLIIEAETTRVMAQTLFYGAIAEEIDELVKPLERLKATGFRMSEYKIMRERIKYLLVRLESIQGLTLEIARGISIHSPEVMKDNMLALRKIIDELEHVVSHARWPVPNYAQMTTVY